MADFCLYLASASPEGGIYRYHFSGDRDGFSAVPLDVTPCPSCGYLRVEGSELLALSRKPFPDSPFSGLMTFSVGSDGSLSNPSEMLSTRGISGCHMTKAAGCYYAVNYVTGNIVRLPDGKTVYHKGSGVLLPRQEGPHTHCVQLCPGGAELAVADLGLDTVSLYDLDLNLLDEATVPAGSGARHLCFSPDGTLLYCIGEIDSVIHVFRYEPGKLTYQNSIPAWAPALPEADASAIRCDGRFLYTANRKHSKIAVLDLSGDAPVFLREIPCEGINPRDFAIYGSFGFSCNCGSDSVTVFYMQDGAMTPLGHICIPVPYSAAFFPL